MKVLVYLVIALYLIGCDGTKPPKTKLPKTKLPTTTLPTTKLPKKIQFGTYVIYDVTFRNRSRSDIGEYFKFLLNSINARLRVNVTETRIQLVLVGMKEVPDSAIVKIPGGYRGVYMSDVFASLSSYLKNETTKGIKQADIVLFITGLFVDPIPYYGEYYRAFGPRSGICTQDKGIVAVQYNPEFSRMSSYMFALVRFLGSDEPGGVAAYLKTKPQTCLTKSPHGLYKNVTKLPGEGLEGNAYCRAYSDNRDDFSLCESKKQGCLLSCCWNHEKREARETSAPDGFACGDKKICFMDKCEPRSILKEREKKSKTPKPKKPSTSQ